MDSLLRKFAAARARREPLRHGAHGPTDACRLLDGSGDGPEFADLVVEDFAGRWLVGTARPGSTPPDWLRAVRPAPRAIYWKRLDAREKLPPQPWAGEPVETPFEIQEDGLRYRIDFQAGYSQGIFLDQRDNRAALRDFCAAWLAERAGPPAVLNLFAYTCAFSVAAAAGGAHTVSVDLSKSALAWGRENFALNAARCGPADQHGFYAGDVFDFLRRCVKKDRRFAAVVLDPPTFSRDRAGKIFRVEHDYHRLVALAAALVSPGGTLLCCTNQRSLTATAFHRQLTAGLTAAAVAPAPDGPADRWHRHDAPMPPDFTGAPYLQSVWLTRTEGRGLAA